MRTPPHRAARGFSLVELLVVILVLAILAGTLVPRVSDRRAVARDSRRLLDLRIVREAIEQYYQDRGAYPPASGEGWDVSTDGSFIPELFRTGYLREQVLDPRNDRGHHYAYQVFPEGTFGYPGKGSFYVLAIRKFETPTFTDEHPGRFQSPEKDWSEDFEYVAGPRIAVPEGEPAAQ